MGFVGSPDIEVSVANQEIIPAPPVGWTIGYRFYKFSFFNESPCHIIINNGSPIYLLSGQGFNSDERDMVIQSFIIVEDGVRFNWIGAY